MFSRFKYAVILLLAPIVAGISAVAALSTALAARLPEEAIKLPIVDANAYANIAMENAVFARADADNGRAREDLRENALRTFHSEPTNSLSVSLLGLSEQFAGNTPSARGLYSAALGLSQRDRLANLSLIEDASQRGMITFILERYDVLLRTGGATSDALFDVLATAMKEDAILPHMEAVLAQDPPWAQQFWLKVTPRSGAIRNVGRLRLRLLRRGIVNPAENDDEIIRRLIGQQHFDIAYRLFDRLSASESGSKNFLRNGDFANAPQYAPIDWEAFSGARYGAEVDPVSQALVFSTESTSETLVARQLLPLPTGRYVVDARIRNPEKARSTLVTVRLRCAGGSGDGGVVAVAIDNRPHPIDYRGECDFSWVELWARQDNPSTSASYPPDDTAIESITLVPENGASAARIRADAGGGDRRVAPSE